MKHSNSQNPDPQAPYPGNAPAAPPPKPAIAAPVRPHSASAPPPAPSPQTQQRPSTAPSSRITRTRQGLSNAKPTSPVDVDEENKTDVAVKVVRAAPPWLVSMVAHMLLLVALGLFYLPSMVKPELVLNFTYAEQEGEQLLDDSLDMQAIAPLELDEQELAFDVAPLPEPQAAPPQVELAPLDGVVKIADLAAPDIGLALTGREAGMKKALLAAYGGTAKTEEAVELGLQWLKRNQRRDGFWSLSGPYSDGAFSENRTAATAMALLAFQGAGHTHQSGDFQREVSRGWEALLGDQDADGVFFTSSVPQNHRLYSQAQATIALCELYGMTRDEKYRRPAQKAIDYAVRIQSHQRNVGGWRYEPGVDSDLSVTGWFVMALQSALMAGLEVPSPTLEAVSEFLDSVQTHDGAGYKYQPERRDRTPAMTAEGLLCRQYLGWKRDNPRLLEGAEYLLDHPVDYQDDENVYYWYYATQVTHHLGDSWWDEWNRVMRQEVPSHQVKSGREKGSWPPRNDRWGMKGGRLFVTCLSIYMLEVYYRHLPIYNHQL